MLKFSFSVNSNEFIQRLLKWCSREVNASDYSIFIASLKDELRSLPFEELINVLERGSVFVRLDAIANNLFCADDVLIERTGNFDSMDFDHEEAGYEWIFSFEKYHPLIITDDDRDEVGYEDFVFPELIGFSHEQVLLLLFEAIDSDACQELDDSYSFSWPG